MTLEEGIDLMRQERWFDAHEALEAEWREAPEPERDFLQGLVHVTVAWHHASRGNGAGASRQLEKAARRLAPYRLGVELLAALRAIAGEGFRWRAEAYEFVADRPAIDLLAGTDRLRLALDAEDAGALAAWISTWPDDEAAFRDERRAALIYPEER